MRTRSGSILQLFLSSLVFLFVPPLLSGIDTIDAIGEIAELCPGLPPKAQSELYHTGKTSRFYFTPADSTRYLPESAFSAAITENLTEIAPNIGVETLYLFEAPGISPAQNDMLGIYNLLRKLSTVKGIEYYSASRGRTRTFFREFYTIDGPEQTGPVPDRLVASIPREDVLYAFQEDLTFGKNISRLRYRYERPFIALSIVNLEKMRYALIPLIQEEDMQTHLIIYVLDGFIMFYGNCGVSTIEFFGLVNKKKESFSNRVEAMYRWFRGQYEGNFLTEF
jgi:hypothetical protein